MCTYTLETNTVLVLNTLVSLGYTRVFGAIPSKIEILATSLFVNLLTFFSCPLVISPICSNKSINLSAPLSVRNIDEGSQL